MARESVNMTEGGILKNLLGFAVPVLIGNIFQQLYNVADTAIIGNILGDDALAAAGAAAPVYNLIVSLSTGLTNGFAVVIARYFGANNERRMKKAVSLTYILCAVTALLLTAAGALFLHPLLKALKTPAEIISDTESYMRVIVLFCTVTVAYNMFAAMMRAVGNSKAPLYFLVISAFANVGLDFLFVKGFGLGVPGAAYATVIAQGISVLLCLFYMMNKCRFLVFDKRELSWDKGLLFDLAGTGLSMALMYTIVSIGSVILQSAVNSLGKDIITAHTAARKIDDIFMMPLGTASMATSTFSSQNYGAEKYDRVNRGIRCGIMTAMVWSAFSVTVTALFRVPLIRALTGTENEAVISAASMYIIINTACFFVLSVLLVLRSSLQGVGRKLVPVTGSVVELLMKIAAAAFIAPKLGYFGVCILEPVIWTVCSGFVLADYAVFKRNHR